MKRPFPVFLLMMLAGCYGIPLSPPLGTIFYTVDGGQTWKGTSAVHETSQINSASFPTARTGYAVSGDGLVKITLK